MYSFYTSKTAFTTPYFILYGFSVNLNQEYLSGFEKW